jgi:uncharacterized protein YjbI with pentapeptide repeats
MGQITLKGINTQGIEWEKTYEVNHTISVQQEGLISLDLTPLKDCSNLLQLDLSSNDLRSIDLTPLSGCTELEDLYIYNNHLYEIDLSPLRSCVNLKKINLYNNHISSVDLEPLKECSHLQRLNLYANSLSEVDLSSLVNCKELTDLIIASPVTLLWTGTIPIKEDLAEGLHSYYARIRASASTHDKAVSLSTVTIKITKFRNAIQQSDEIPFSIARNVLSFASDEELIEWLWTLNLTGLKVDYSTSSIQIIEKELLVDSLNRLF